MPSESSILWWYDLTDHVDRVEKYRPNSLEDVSGHQDILATINRFVDANVFHSFVDINVSTLYLKY